MTAIGDKEEDKTSKMPKEVRVSGEHISYQSLKLQVLQKSFAESKPIIHVKARIS